MTTKFLTLLAVASLIGLPACSKASTPKTESKPRAAAVQPSKSTMNLSHMSAVQAGEMLAARPNVIVLDVRTPGEFAQSHLKGAINIDFKNPNFAQNLRALDATKRYLVHCRSGARSTRSLAVFKQEEFTSIIHMDGGIIAWNAAGLPTVN